MMVSNRALPGRDHVWGNEAWPGREARPFRLPRLVTMLGDRAAVRNNELVPTR
jgi:hypothetical protein